MSKILTVGKEEIRVQHFTTDVTNFPFIMDSNCYMAFSHLWRKYIACSANENLITDDNWFQYPLKSLAIHCGFGDIGTLRRAVEGLYRYGVIDVRVEEGSRLWACWKLNKSLIERLASLSDRDAMDEPYLKAIVSIESKDKEFTYMLNKDGIEGLKEFFGVRTKAVKPPNTVENPPLLNTIIQYNDNTIEQQYDKTTEQKHNNTKTQQNYTDVVEGNNDNLDRNSLKEDFEILTEEAKENQNEPKSQIEGNDDSNRYQPIENKQLTPSENKEISKAFRTLEFCKPSIDTNTLNYCLDLLHEVSKSNRETYKDCLAKANIHFNQLLEGYTKEERKPITKALNDLSRVLGDAFRNKNTKQK